jgi:hypothetical protein
MITKWKKHAVDLLPSLFSMKPEHEREEREQREKELFQRKPPANGVLTT